MKILALPEIPVADNDLLKDVIVIPDSSLQRYDRPFFIPDTTSRYEILAGFIFRVCKVGKPSSARFSSRYYDAWTVGLNFVDTSARASGFSPAYYRAYHNSLSAGPFQPIETFMQENDIFFSIDNNTFKMRCSEPPFMDRIIYEFGRRFSLRTGDMLIPGFISTGLTAECDTHLTARCGDTTLLSFNIK